MALKNLKSPNLGFLGLKKYKPNVRFVFKLFFTYYATNLIEMLSNDQVFQPCTKSCKPNRLIPVAKRYSIKSTPFISSSRFTTIIVSAV